MNIYPLENGLVEWIIGYPQMLNISLKINRKTAVRLCLGPQECLISIKIKWWWAYYKTKG